MVFTAGQFNELRTVSIGDCVASLKNDFAGYIVNNMLSKRLADCFTVVNIENAAKLILIQQAVTHQVVLQTRVIERTEESGDGKLLVLANPDHHGLGCVRLDLNPWTLGRNQGCRELPVQGEVKLITEVNTWGTGKLGHNDTLSAVDHE
mgnify:CR=1 FL=1